MTDPMSLQGVRMRALAGSASSVISGETLFEFEQTGDLFSARYRGGEIAEGYLIGRRHAGGALEFRYVQADRTARIDAGESTGVLDRLSDGRLQLVESFQWTTRPEAGRNVLEEVRGQGGAEGKDGAWVSGGPARRGETPMKRQPQAGPQ